MSQGAIPMTAGGGGAAVRGYINAALARLQTKGSGTSRPSDIAAGEDWIETDNPGGGVWAWWLYDGTSDILLGIIDSTTHAVHFITGQIVSAFSGAVDTTSTTIPLDDSIPQNTEGKEFLSLAITPLRSTSKLVIEVVVNVANSIASTIMAALFQDSTASALKAAWTYAPLADGPAQVTFRHVMAAGTTSATTFKVRAGGTGGTLTFNGAAGSRYLGGVMASSIVIREVLA